MRRISLRYIFHRWRVCIVRVYILMMPLLSFVFVWSGFWCRQREKAKCFQLQLDKQNDRQMEMNFTFCFRVRSLPLSSFQSFHFFVNLINFWFLKILSCQRYWDWVSRLISCEDPGCPIQTKIDVSLISIMSQTLFTSITQAYFPITIEKWRSWVVDLFVWDINCVFLHNYVLLSV